MRRPNQSLWANREYYISCPAHEVINLVLCYECCLHGYVKGPRRESCTWDFYHTTNTLHTEYLTSYTNTSQPIGYQSLTLCKILPIPLAHNLHATCTAHMQPHGTSTGGWYHGIGGAKSLLLRQISLRPCAVKSTAYDKTDCATAGCDM